MTKLYFKDIRKKKIDKAGFENKNTQVKALYGLPNEIKYCKSCVVSNQRPNSSIEFQTGSDGQNKDTINIDDSEICDACKVNEFKKKVNWEERKKELEAICDKHRRNNGEYDCLIPGSGGKDSLYASWILKNDFGMHPLTVTWAPNLYTDWGRRNLQKWIEAGFDNQLFTPNQKVHRILTRIATENLLHPFQPFILGQKLLPPKIAKSLNIPLVFYGENEAEYGNPQSEANNSKRTKKYYTYEKEKQIFISGMEINQILENFSLDKNALNLYLPSSSHNNINSKVEVHYLGYYIKWHPQNLYYHSVKNFNFEPCPHRNPGTFSKYASLDDKLDDLHYYTTYIKFGIGRATHDASQEIRNNDITRSEAINIVEKYDGEYPRRFIPELMKYLSLPEKDFPGASKLFEQPIMDEEYFIKLCDTFRSPHIWTYENDWKLRKAIWHKSG